MRFCQEHWDALRSAIRERGLYDLVAKDGAIAAENLQAEAEGRDTLANYDPLMAAHWAIINNAMGAVGPPNAMYLMSNDEPQADEDGRKWPVCPLCYLNQAHALTCTDPACTLDRERGYDMWIDRAADDQAQRVREMVAGDSSLPGAPVGHSRGGVA